MIKKCMSHFYYVCNVTSLLRYIINEKKTSYTVNVNLFRFLSIHFSFFFQSLCFWGFYFSSPKHSDVLICTSFFSSVKCQYVWYVEGCVGAVFQIPTRSERLVVNRMRVWACLNRLCLKGALCRIEGDLLAETAYSIHKYVFIIV